MRRNSFAALICALVMVSLSGGFAQAQWIRTGVLTCDVSGGIGLIIGGQQQVSCVFQPDVPGPQERYFGNITKFGLDIGITAGGVMVWGVYNQTTRGYGFLAGDYAGATGEASVVAGLGANVLVGGSNRTVALQPLSVGGQVGLNLAVGVANLSLRVGR
jgi:hypothetical protein